MPFTHRNIASFRDMNCMVVKYCYGMCLCALNTYSCRLAVGSDFWISVMCSEMVKAVLRATTAECRHASVRVLRRQNQTNPPADYVIVDVCQILAFRWSCSTLPIAVTGATLQHPVPSTATPSVAPINAAAAAGTRSWKRERGGRSDYAQYIARRWFLQRLFSGKKLATLNQRP